MDSELLIGSVKHHVRHLVALSDAADWPAHIGEGEGLAAEMARAVELLHADIRFPIKVTAAAPVPAGPSAPAAGDVLVFPDMLRHRAVHAADAAALVSRYAASGADTVSSPVPPVERLGGRHLLVCVHGARDERCGEAGPPLLTALADELKLRGIADVTLYGGSHVGGHRFAGCVLAFPSGDWYGQLAAADAAELVGECVVAQRVLTNHWRGRLGLTQEAQLAATAG